MADITLHEGLAQIDAAAWDALAAPEQATGRPEDPFTTHRFLAALESSGAADPARRRHAAGRAADVCEIPQPGRVHLRPGLGRGLPARRRPVLPEAAGGLALHPGPGRRFLGPAEHRTALADAAIGLAQGNDLSSLHITFCTAAEACAALSWMVML